MRSIEQNLCINRYLQEAGGGLTERKNVRAIWKPILQANFKVYFFREKKKSLKGGALHGWITAPRSHRLLGKNPSVGCVHPLLSR